MEHHVYDRVYIIGVDGAGNFFTKTDTPNIDRIFADGAYNHNTVTAEPTISAQCWGSLLHGVTPQAHRFTNGLVGDFPVPENHPYPSIFKEARKAFPDAALASVSNWNPINTGIIEQGLGVYEDTGSDEEVCEKVCAAIKEKDPKLLFVQFDSVDGAGHAHVYGSKPYLEQITYVDSLIGKIYDTALSCGTLDNTLIIVTADHGGAGTDHGGSTDGERLISYFVSGESVVPGEFGYAEIRDTAAITAFALGFEQPECWSSRIPDGLFEDGVSFERPSEAAKDGTKRYSGRKNLPTPEKSGKRLGDFLRMEGMRCYFPFDKNADDAAGKCITSVNGKIYYPEGFYGSGAKLDDCIINCSDINAGTDNYTFAVWIKKDFAGGDKRLDIFSTMKDETDTGLAFYIIGDELYHVIGTGGENVVYKHRLPANYTGNWFHFICSYDRSPDELCYYYDFTLETDWYSDKKLPKQLALDGHKTTAGGYSPLTLDDLIVFDHKLSDHEIDDLERYYGQEN